MIRLVINGRDAQAEAGTTVLAAAEVLGIRIPTMCFDARLRPSSSCMVCVVKDRRNGRLIPACAAPAEDGMAIETDAPEVRDARRTAIELLLSEHVGDCEGPCRRGCPARVDAPRMIRQIAAGDAAAARRTLGQTLALPGVVAHLCHAPCEKVCRRREQDGAVSIRLLERWAWERGRGEPAYRGPEHEIGTAAVVGAGPAGLAAACHLRLAGWACTVFDAGARPGGSLLAVPPAELPPAVLKADLDALAGMGIVFRRGTRVGADVTLDELRRTFAVVVLAVGAQGLPALALSGLKPWAERGTAGAAVHGDGAGLFACGSAVRSRPHVIQALADGMAAARAAIGFVEGSSRSPRFDCRIGRLKEGELAEFMKETDPGPRREPRAAGAGFDRDDAAREAGRCLHCDCRKPEACKLRAHAEEYGAGQDAFRGEDRNGFVRVVGHPDVIFEPGKCIRCGLCVQVTAQAGEKPGLAFIGRGYTQRVGVPFAESLAQALRLSAAECVAVCPTGALAWKRGE